jgi:hypothetical protein
MPDKKPYNETDPRHHTEKLKRMVKDTANHAREDVDQDLGPQGSGII